MTTAVYIVVGYALLIGLAGWLGLLFVAVHVAIMLACVRRKPPP